MAESRVSGYDRTEMLRSTASGEVRLDHGAGAVVRRSLARAPGPRVRSSVISMPIDEPPKRGFTMYGPGNGGSVVDAERGPRAARPARPPCITPPNASLSIPRAAPAARRSGVPDAGQVEGGLEGAVLAGSAVAAVDDGADLERPAASEAARLGGRTRRRAEPRVEPVRAAGTPVDEVRGSRDGIDLEESPVLAQ